MFRIGHLGSFNDLSLAGTLSGVEMGLELAGVPFRKAAFRPRSHRSRRPLQKRLKRPLGKYSIG